jgi:hypothetical protein
MSSHCYFYVNAAVLESLLTCPAISVITEPVEKDECRRVGCFCIRRVNALRGLLSLSHRGMGRNPWSDWDF